MNRSQITVTNAANLSFFMVNLSSYLLVKSRQDNSDARVRDLKPYYRGLQYVWEMLKMLPEQPEPILLERIFTKLTSLGSIHNGSTAVLPP